ncbi:MAG: hypothetical protein HOP09_14710 [Hyphomicrobium sp.]|nr:hypothetical protein [Hyphomicrobium sp.]
MPEADSRHTVPTLRWGETALEVVSPSNVAEPSGGKKDVGWVPGGEGVIGEWLNWLHWAAGVFNRYMERRLAATWVRGALMADESGLRGNVTAGAGLSINIVVGTFQIAGAMYNVPGVLNKPLTAAHATLPRLDLVVARVVSGSPAYYVIDGTPAASPAAPAMLAGDARVAQVRVNAASGAPGTITDLREFGAYEGDAVIARHVLEVGGVLKVGSTEPGAGRDTIIIGDPADPTAIFYPPIVKSIALSSSALQFLAPVQSKILLTAGDRDAEHPSPGTFSRIQQTLTCSSGTGFFDWPIKLPIPHQTVTITGIKINGNRTTNTYGVSFELLEFDHTVGGAAVVVATADNVGVGASGDFSLSLALSFDLELDKYYILRPVAAGVAGALTIYGAEVSYEYTYPHLGWT